MVDTLASRAGLVDFNGEDPDPVKLADIQDSTEDASILKYAIDHGIEISGKTSNTRAALEVAMNMLSSNGERMEHRTHCF